MTFGFDVCGVFSWLMTDVEEYSPLWIVLSMDWCWIVCVCVRHINN